ncbi:MAG: hypothetical protein E7076_03650 [Bacteroidales bacterium]|nr:hypothetical protein [Bacteroidales bacterium]
MKRARIGNTDIDLTQYYWTDNRPEWDLRVSEKYLFSELDLLQSEADNTESEEEDNRIYNKMDLVWVQLLVSWKYGGDKEMLLRAGYALSCYVAEGAFENIYSNMDERDNEVMNIFAGVCRLTENDTPLTSCDFDFMDRFIEHVVDYDYYFDAETGKPSNTPIAGVRTVAIAGSEEFTSFNELVKFTASDYGYLTNPQEANKYKKARGKYNGQLSLITKMAIKSGNQTAGFINSVNSGINDATTTSSDQFVSELKKGKLKYKQPYIDKVERASGRKIAAIGEPASTVAAVLGLIKLIIGIIAALVGLMTAVLSFVQQIKYFRENQKQIAKEAELYAPDYDDFNDAVNKRGEAIQKRETVVAALKYGGLAAALFAVFTLFSKR